MADDVLIEVAGGDLDGGGATGERFRFFVQSAFHLKEPAGTAVLNGNVRKGAVSAGDSVTVRCRAGVVHVVVEAIETPEGEIPGASEGQQVGLRVAGLVEGQVGAGDVVVNYQPGAVNRAAGPQDVSRGESAASRFARKQKQRHLAQARGTGLTMIAAVLAPVLIVAAMLLAGTALVFGWPFGFMSMNFIQVVPALIAVGVFMLIFSAPGRRSRGRRGIRSGLASKVQDDLPDAHEVVRFWGAARILNVFSRRDRG